VRCDSPLALTVLGETRDDAAGEAYDKSAKLLGLPYPGGPLIDQYASSGNPHRYTFPEPQIDGYDFSFSGVKTAIMYFLRENLQSDAGFVEKNLPDICASIQHRINTILVNKFRKAALATGIRELCMAGGVSANTGLRKLFREMGDSLHANIFIPPFEYCTDNAAMIAITAHYKYLAGEFADLSISPEARAKWD
jgi:N6-L-threonylcarbamoyladenine synthase